MDQHKQTYAVGYAFLLFTTEGRRTLEFLAQTVLLCNVHVQTRREVQNADLKKGFFMKTYTFSHFWSDYDTY